MSELNPKQAEGRKVLRTEINEIQGRKTRKNIQKATKLRKLQLD